MVAFGIDGHTVLILKINAIVMVVPYGFCQVSVQVAAIVDSYLGPDLDGIAGAEIECGESELITSFFAS